MRPLLLLAALIASSAAASERHAWFRGLDLADRVASARLILSAEVAAIDEETVIVGGKGELSVMQIRFRPLRVLKGVYTRDELLLTDRDIGSHAEPYRVRDLRPGEQRLLLLDRHSRGYGLAGFANDFDHAVPPLAGADDSLLEAVQTLIETQRQDRRVDQARHMLRTLARISGAGAVALLRPLRADAVLVAQISGGLDTVARHLQDPSPAVRAEAAATLQSILAQDYLVQADLHGRVAERLVDAVSRSGEELVAAQALFHALAAARPPSISRRLRQVLTGAVAGEPLAIRAARLRAAGHLRVEPLAGGLAAQLAEEPVDSPEFIVRDIAHGAIDYSPDAAARALRTRMQHKVSAGLAIDEEIAWLIDLPRTDAVNLLGGLDKSALLPREQTAYANVVTHHPDPATVSTLAAWSRSHHPGLRASTLNALLAIDTRESAAAARAQLGPELELGRKLRLAEFLGRHGFRDGYAFAVEHMSEAYLRDDAVAALVAMRDPRTAAEMHRILDTSNDDAWNASALLVLAGMGEQSLRDRLYGLAQNARRGTVPAAAIVALAELGDPRVLELVREWLGKRDGEMEIAAARAARIALVKHRMPAEDILDRLAAILSDGRDWVVTRQAFETLAALDDRRLDDAAAAALRNSRQLDDFQGLIVKRLRSRHVRVISPGA